MKKICIILILTIITISVLLCSCSIFKGGNQMQNSRISSDLDQANSRMEKLVDALENKDKDTLKLMFSKNAINNSDNFDDDLNKLIDMYHGDFVSYDDWGSVDTEETINGSEELKILYSTYDITTSEQVYRITIKDILTDTKEVDNVGMFSLYIIKYEDDTDSRFAYVGDLKYKAGINFDVKNVIEYELPE